MIQCLLHDIPLGSVQLLDCHFTLGIGIGPTGRSDLTVDGKVCFSGWVERIR